MAKILLEVCGLPLSDVCMLLILHNRQLRASPEAPAPTVEDFVISSDLDMYGPSSARAGLAESAELRLLNSVDTVEELYRALDGLNLTNLQRLRPSWDQYFMQLASLAAHRSNCMKRRVGCVLVREKRVISTGYNGTPRNITNCNEGGCTFFKRLSSNAIDQL